MHYKRSLIETISYDKSGYYVSPNLEALRFEKEKYAELAYHIYSNVFLLVITPLDFLILIQNGQSSITGK